MDSSLKNQEAGSLAETSNEKLYLRILDSMVGLSLVTDRDFRIVYNSLRNSVNEGSQVQSGGRLHCYYYHNKAQKCDTCHLENVFRNGLPEFVTKKCPLSQEDQVYIFPIFDENGTVTMAGEMPRKEITPLRQMIEESLGTKEVLMAIIEAAPLAIIAVDNEFKVILWNPAAERILGWRKEEVFGKIYPMLSTVMRDDILDNFHRIQNGEVCNFVETKRMRKDNTIVDISLSSVLLQNSKGIAIGSMAIMEDITERNKSRQALKESYASYRTIFDSANDAIFLLDSVDATILDVNMKMCEMFGFQNLEAALRQSMSDMVSGTSPYMLEDLLPLVWKARDGELQCFEWLARHTSGRLFWIEATMKGVIISGEYKVLAVVRDITERKVAEAESGRLQEKLMHADKMAALGTLTSGIAHEINNPNNYILSNAQFLADAWPDISRVLNQHAKENGDFFLRKMRYSDASSKIPKIIDGIAGGAHRIKGIITNLKDFSRQEKTFLAQDVDVNEVIEAALSLLQHKIKKHTDFFKCRLEETIPLVRGNFRQLEQVVVNLMLNALESLPAKDHGVMIATSYSKRKGQISIKVSDEGVGMSEEIKKSIFDPFFSTKLETGGTGLGLSISFTIISKHNGTIECNSKSGEGTTFRVLLPTLNNCK